MASPNPAPLQPDAFVYVATLSDTVPADNSELPLEMASTALAGRSTSKSFLHNAVSNLIRIGITALVSIFLPTFLTHRLSTQTYGAWVLILQLSAYVSYLNLGVQTAVSKYVAEYEAKGDLEGAGKCASAGMRIMLVAAALGLLVSGGLGWFLPHLFPEMPPALMWDVRVSVLLVGSTLSISLATSIFSAIFLGLQRYDVPMYLGVAGRLLYGAAVCTVVMLHRGLIVMAVITSALNLLTCAAEWIAWRKLIKHVEIVLFRVDGVVLRRMLAYCSVLTVWSACMLLITGLDVTIVGHYDFARVAFYSIANSPTNMMLLLVGALMGPLLPVTSALSVSSTPAHMGQVLLRTTRYSTVLLLGTGLPLLVAGFPAIRLWVGNRYAVQSLLFLHLLLMANILRNLTAPYSTMVVAISRQKVGTVSAVSEGVVNLACSILLARRFGAAGVAAGTLIGSIVGLALHFGVTMHYTRGQLDLSRLQLFVGGILRPAVMAVPTVLLFSRWWPATMPSIPAWGWALWSVSSAMLTWFVSLLPEDHAMVLKILRRRAGRA